MSANWLHNPCRLGDPQIGDIINSGSPAPAAWGPTSRRINCMTESEVAIPRPHQGPVCGHFGYIASAVSRGPEPATETKGGCIAFTFLGLDGMAA